LPGAAAEPSAGGAGYLDIHAGDSLLLVATLDGTVHAISGASGELLWSLDAGGPLVSSSAFDTAQLIADDLGEREEVDAEPGAPAPARAQTPAGRLGAAGPGASRPARRADAGVGSAGAWASVADAEDARRAASSLADAAELRPGAPPGPPRSPGGLPSGADADAEGEFGRELDVAEEELIVLPGLDGSIFLVDSDAEELTKLTEHTVQVLDLDLSLYEVYIYIYIA